MARLTVEIEMSMVAAISSTVIPSIRRSTNASHSRRQAIEEGVELSQEIAGLHVQRAKAEVAWRFGHEG